MIGFGWNFHKFYAHGSGRRLHQFVDQRTQRSRINGQRIDHSFDPRCAPDTEYRLGERTIFAAQLIVGERILRIAARDRGFRSEPAAVLERDPYARPALRRKATREFGIFDHLRRSEQTADAWI